MVVTKSDKACMMYSHVPPPPSQVYMGQLRNKCVLELPSEAATNWTVWVTNSSHWFYVNGEPELCGNASGARSVGVGGAVREG